jgi:hypothetical protein
MTEPRRHKNQLGHQGHEPLPPGEVLEPPPPTPGEDVNIGLITRFGVGLVVMCLAVSGLLWLFASKLARDAAGKDPAIPALARHAPRRTPEGVRLQQLPFADIERQRREESEILDTYGWVDEKSGVVRIPIEQAMRLLARRGLPVRSEVAAASPGPTEAPTPSPTAVPARPRPRPRPSPSTTAPAADPAAAPTSERTAAPTAEPAVEPTVEPAPGNGARR